MYCNVTQHQSADSWRNRSLQINTSSTSSYSGVLTSYVNDALVAFGSHGDGLYSGNSNGNPVIGGCETSPHGKSRTEALNRGALVERRATAALWLQQFYDNLVRSVAQT